MSSAPLECRPCTTRHHAFGVACLLSRAYLRVSQPPSHFLPQDRRDDRRYDAPPSDERRRDERGPPPPDHLQNGGDNGDGGRYR